MPIVARNYATGFSRHWVGFTGMAAGQSPLRSTEGDVAAFPAVSPEVLNIRALTMLVQEPVLIAIDDEGRIWHVSAEDGGMDDDPVATIDTATYGAVQFAIRDGLYRVVYVVCEEAVLKYFPDVAQIKLFKEIDYPTDVGHMLGYDGLAQPRTLVDLLAPGKGKVWYYDGTGWTDYGTGTLPNVQLTGAVANPLNRFLDWMAWRSTTDAADYAYSGSNRLELQGLGVSPIWRTEDGGATLDELDLIAANNLYDRLDGFWAEYDWQTDGLLHIIIAKGPDDSFNFKFVVMYRGTGSSIDEFTVYGDADANLQVNGMYPGFSGDTVYSMATSNDAYGLFYVPGGEPVVAEGPIPPVNMVLESLDLLKGSFGAMHAVIGLKASTSSLRASSDYREFGATERLTIGASSATATLDEVYVAVGQDIRRITDPLGSPSSEVVYSVTGSESIGKIRASRLTRGAIVAPILNSGVVGYAVFDGQRWTRVAPPPGVPAGELANWAEPIERETA